MTNEQTAEVADDLFGDKLYQRRARAALPVLVRYAIARQTVTYETLAEQLQMPNARNLNYVLGSIGVTLAGLSERWAKPIPKIALLVVNKATRMPGHGVDGLLNEDLSSMTRQQRRVRVDEVLASVFAYSKWALVLDELGLPQPPAVATELIEEARNRGGGESEQHRALKEAIAANPRLVGLPADFGPGEVEFSLPSGDVVDVVFRNGHRWAAIEVKSAISDLADITRGLFQCVKYDAVLNAWRATQGESADVIVKLALESSFPEILRDLQSTLSIEVTDAITSSPS